MHKLLFALALALLWLAQLGGSARADPPPASAAIALTYAQVVDGYAAVYASPQDAVSGILPVKWLAPGFVFVSVGAAEPEQAAGEAWYRLNGEGYIRAWHLSIFQPSTFHGIQIPAPPERPFAWVLRDARPSPAPGAWPAPNTPPLVRYSAVSLLEEQRVGEWNWYRVGEGQWLPQYRLGIVSPQSRPAGVAPQDKWIEVNLYEQTLAAYEGDRMVYATLISSGLAWWPTAPGLFQIYAKARLAPMSGRSGLPDYYYLEDVPWIMYFNKDTALHGAYWHDDFGVPHSHGCVNLAPEDALWLFNWSGPTNSPGNWTVPTAQNPATWVWVH